MIEEEVFSDVFGMIGGIDTNLFLNCLCDVLFRNLTMAMIEDSTTSMVVFDRFDHDNLTFADDGGMQTPRAVINFATDGVTRPICFDNGVFEEVFNRKLLKGEFEVLHRLKLRADLEDARGHSNSCVRCPNRSREEDKE